MAKKYRTWKQDEEENSNPVDVPVKVPVVKTAEGEVCGTCLFYSPHPGGTHYGECTQENRRRTVSVSSPSCPEWQAQ